MFLSMLTDQPTAVLFAQLLDLLPDGVVCYDAVRNKGGGIVDFRLTYFNDQFRAIAPPPYQLAIGIRMIADNPGQEDILRPIVNQYALVVEQDEVAEYSFYDPNLDAHLALRVKKLSDGVLVTIRDVTEQKRQARLLNQLLDTSPACIVSYKAKRDQYDEIVDFRQISLNQKALDISGLTEAQMLSSTLLQLYPDQRAVFDQLAKAVETKQTINADVLISSFGGWYNVSVAPSGSEGAVAVYVAINAKKAATLEAERRKDELVKVLNSSITGMLMCQAVANEAGEIVDFQVVFHNESALAITGYTAEQVTSLKLSALDPTGATGGMHEGYLHVLATGEPLQIEYYFEPNQRWLEISVVRFTSEQVIVSFLDISALKETQLREQDQTRRFETILDGSPDGVITFESIHDVTGRLIDLRYVQCNRAAHQMAQLPDDVIGCTLLGVYSGVVSNEILTIADQVISSGQSATQEVQDTTDTIDKWYLLSVARLDDGCVVTFTDISQSKQAALAINEAAAQLQGIIDTSQTGIFLFSPVRDEAGVIVDFRFRTANRMLAEYVGQKPEGLRGELGSRWFPAYKSNGLFERYLQTYETGQSIRFDFYYQADGIDSWLDIAATRLGDDVLVTFADFTPLKRLQQRLELSVQELKRSNANLEQFAYVASHDLQEPLRKVITFGDVLQNQYADQLSESGADMVRRMQSAAQRMQTLIQDLLTYSRIANKRNAFQQVDLSQVLDEVIMDLEATIHSKKAVLHVEPLPTIHGDALQLRQLFQNLLSNALKFSKEDVQPSVTIASRLVSGQNTNQLSVPVGQKFVEVTVSDNGIGFEQTYAERIFQLFQRLHTRSNYSGTGIGLSIVQKVVENHHGIIRAEGRSGQGASFVILFPTENVY